MGLALRTSLWVEGARPKTWVAGLSPALLGAALAWRKSDSIEMFNLPILCITLLFVLSIQITTNYANDYFDGVNGIDHAQRVGPRRLVGTGTISPRSMLYAMWTIGLLATLLGLYLSFVSRSLLLLALLPCCLALTLVYSTGPFPLSHYGLGELFALIFFGPVATLSTIYLQLQQVDRIDLLLSCAPGLFAAALLLVNNLRDYRQDKLTYKHTLVVRLGLSFGKGLYLSMLIVAMSLPIVTTVLSPTHAGTLLALLGSIRIPPLLSLLYRAHTPQQFSPLLNRTAHASILYLITLTIGLII